MRYSAKEIAWTKGLDADDNFGVWDWRLLDWQYNAASHWRMSKDTAESVASILNELEARR